MNLPREIDGPISASIFTVKFGIVDKLVILLGDAHDLPKFGCPKCGRECKKLVPFLKDLFKKTKICVDFFVETKFVSKEEERWRNPYEEFLIENVEEEFWDCLGPIKEECEKFGNVRMHYSDLRKYPLGLHLYPSIYKELTEIRRYSDLGYLPRKREHILEKIEDELTSAVERTPQIIKYVLGVTEKKPLGHKYLPDQLRPYREFQKRLIKKQLDALPKNVKEEILKEFGRKEMIEHPVKISIQRAISAVNVMIDSSSIPEELYEELYSYLFGIVPSAIMDVYLLARLLKPSLSDSNIVVVYAGGGHITDYRNFFKKADFAEVVWEQPPRHVKGKYLKCVSIPPRIIERIKKTTQRFPKRPCSTKKILRKTESKLAQIYKVEDKVIRQCLEETSKVHSIPVWKVAKIVSELSV